MILLRLLPSYAVQYASDITDIEEYLKTYITVVDHAGFADDQDVTSLKFCWRDPKSILIKLLISSKVKQFF
jgi:hypothetical protein